MKKYYMAYVDMSDIRNVTANEEQLETARNRMGELGLLTPGGKPSAAKIGQAAQRKVPPMLEKLERRLRRHRDGGVGTVIRTMQMLYAQGDMQALYLYTAIFYGVIEWRVPEELALLPAEPAGLKMYMDRMMEYADGFLETLEKPKEEGAGHEETADQADDSE